MISNHIYILSYNDSTNFIYYWHWRLINLFFNTMCFPIDVLSPNTPIFKIYDHMYILSLLFTLWSLINTFTSLDLFFLYIFFEGIVTPMFLLIGNWGSRSRKIYASYQFFIHTLLGSYSFYYVFWVSISIKVLHLSNFWWMLDLTLVDKFYSGFLCFQVLQ